MSAHLETTASGPTVELRDGIPRARIGVDNETASMSLSGKDDPAMLYLSQSSLTISDKQYNGRVSLHLHSDERCGVYLSDASGEQVGSITQGSHGGMILLTNSKGETRAIRADLRAIRNLGEGTARRSLSRAQRRVGFAVVMMWLARVLGRWP